MNFVPEIVRDDRVSEGLVRDFLHPSPRGNYWFSEVYWLIGEGVRDGRLNPISISLIIFQ